MTNEENKLLTDIREGLYFRLTITWMARGYFRNMKIIKLSAGQ